MHHRSCITKDKLPIEAVILLIASFSTALKKNKYNSWLTHEGPIEVLPGHQVTMMQKLHDPAFMTMLAEKI